MNLLPGMDTESYSVDQILEAIDIEMDNLKPKVLLFDIGGVCVSRPSRKLVWFARPQHYAWLSEAIQMHAITCL